MHRNGYGRTMGFAAVNLKMGRKNFAATLNRLHCAAEDKQVSRIYNFSNLYLS